MTAVKKATVSLNKDDIREAIADYIEKQLGGKDRAVRPSKFTLDLHLNTVQTIPVNTPTKLELDHTSLWVDVEVSLL